MNKKNPCYWFVSILLLITFKLAGIGGDHEKTNKSFPVIKGNYLGQKLPGKQPELFAPGIVSTELHDDAAPLFSPDGNEVYFRIVWKRNSQYFGSWFVMKKDSNEIWSKPEIAQFSGMQLDGSAVFSTNGEKIYFSSGRPENEADLNNDQNIWWVELTATGWSAPRWIGNHINTDQDDMIASVSSTGSIYFDVESHTNGFQSTPYYAEYRNGIFKQPERITGNLFLVNGGRYSIARDGSFIIQTAPEPGRELDLFISFRHYDGSWSNPQNMGTKINSPQSDKFSGLSPDSKYMFFVSKRENISANPQKIWQTDFFDGNQLSGGADIYWVSTEIISDMKRKYLDENAEYKIDWEIKAPMPEARRNLKIIPYKNTIFAIGGYAQPHKGREKGNFCYDISNDTWSVRREMLIGRSNFAIASVNGKIYAIGGDKFLDDAEEYEPEDNAWTSLTPMPTARQHINCAVMNNKIHIVGGRTCWNKNKPNEGVVRVHEVYDTEIKVWKTLKPFPKAVENLCLAVVNKKLYAINGYDQTVTVYLPETDEWQNLKSIPDSYFLAGITTLDNKIFVLDGVRPGENFARVYVYDTLKDEWKSVTPLPAPVKLSGFTSVNNDLYVIGGCNHDFIANNFLYYGKLVK